MGALVTSGGVVLLSLLRRDCNIDNWVEIACSCVSCDDKEASTLDICSFKSSDVLRTSSDTGADSSTLCVGVYMSLAHIRLH